MDQNYGRDGGLRSANESGSDVGQKDYTLPGIMQYLQSQFTLVEKNRMQNDLEKSSLKLQIVELESERNSLRLQNEQLKVKVKELEKQLGNDVQDKDGLALDTVSSIDVTKLVKARQFLKSSTDEILYLLKTPCLEQDQTDKEGYFVKKSPDYVEMNIPLENGKASTKSKIATSETPSFGTLVAGKLYLYLSKSHTIAVYGKSEKLNEYACPANFDVKDIKATSSYVVALGEHELIVFSAGEPLTYQVSAPATVDVKDNRIVVVQASSVEVLQVGTELKQVFAANYKESGGVLAAQFTEEPKAYAVAILTGSSLLLQPTDASESNSARVINLSKFSHHLLTSKELVVNMPQGLFVIDFSSLTSFNHVPLKKPLTDTAKLGACQDDNSIFYVQDDGIDLFKVIETGDVLNIKSVPSVKGWCTVGAIDEGFTLCAQDENGVLVSTI